MAENPEEKKPEKKKKPSFRQRLSLVFNNVSRKDLKGIFWDTVKDLRKPREIGILLVSSFVPGGWIGWFAYRVAKYQFNKAAANDNNAESSPLTLAIERMKPRFAPAPLQLDEKKSAAPKP